MRKIDIGFVDYINCLPVYYAFDTEEYKEKYNLVKRKPAELNKMMSSGKIQVSNVSSIEYARNHEKYFIIPDICISSIEKVHSVILISTKKINELDGARITLTNSSATSQVLLKIILKEMFNFTNDFTEMHPNLKDMLKVSDGALLIGDEALSVSKINGLYHYDLGRLWSEYTGYPFVFALWIINKEWALNNPVLAKDIVISFKKSLKIGEDSINSIIKKCEKRFPNYDISTYFKDINYDLTLDCIKGLKLFYKKASSMRLSDKCETLKFLDYK